MFPSRLQANAPDAYAVFNLGGDAGKTAAQGLKVMNFIDGAVKSIDDMGAVGGQLDTLAQRHTGYGAKKAHFGVSCRRMRTSRFTSCAVSRHAKESTRLSTKFH